MPIKYALFDFDGTLVDSNEAVISTLNLTAIKHRGKPFTNEELNEVLGKPIEDQVRILSEDQIESLSEFYKIQYRKVRDSLTKSYEGVEEMLLKLKARGIKIGIVSNKGRNGIDHGIEMFGLQDLIDFSVSKNDVTQPKPNPEGIYLALQGLGGTEKELEETIFVGDSGHDIESGKRAGCKTILVGWTLLALEPLKAMGPDYIAQTPEDLYQYIAAL